MSIFLMSSAVASRPKPNVPAAAGSGAGRGVASATGEGLGSTGWVAAAPTNATTTRRSAGRPSGRIEIGDRPVSGHTPVLLTVVVVNRAGAAHAHQVLPRGLDVARLIRSAAGQNRLRAVPGPRQQ